MMQQRMLMRFLSGSADQNLLDAQARIARGAMHRCVR